MTHAQAMKVAIESMQAEAGRLALDANLCDRLGLKEPGTIQASKRRRRLLETIATLSELGSGAHGERIDKQDRNKQRLGHGKTEVQRQAARR